MGIFFGTSPQFDFENSTKNALWILNFLPNTAANIVSKLTEIRGESYSIGTACSASLQAIALAYEKIAYGSLKMAIAGGGDSRLSPWALKAYQDCQALFNYPQDEPIDPNSHYAPFAQNRYGFIPGEGGASFLLEELEHALARDATIYGEIKGIGISCDGHNLTAPAPDGYSAKKAICKALHNSNLSIENIDLISAHGTGTVLNDQVEVKILSDLNYKGNVTALKSWIGHLSSACGAVELALLLSLINISQTPTPKIRNLHTKNIIENSGKIQWMTNSKIIPLSNILVENFGFGGQNVSLILSSFRRDSL